MVSLRDQPFKRVRVSWYGKGSHFETHFGHFAWWDGRLRLLKHRGFVLNKFVSLWQRSRAQLERKSQYNKSTLPVNPFRALINVRTHRMFPMSPPSYITTAFKSSRVVVAWSLWVAHVWVLTLISINTGSAIKGPSNKGRTFATVGPRRVHAFGWWQTLMGANKTLIGVFTRWRSIAPLITEMAKAWS